MPSTLTLFGLNAFRAELRDHLVDLNDHAEAIVEHHAELAKAEIVQRYPIRTGNLRRGVTIRRATSRGLFGRQVLSRAPHAHLYDNRRKGTKQRFTKRGANRGRMPPKDIAVPVAIRHRRLMEDDLIALLIRTGFEVTRT